jgi:hypothetical protein
LFHTHLPSLTQWQLPEAKHGAKQEAISLVGSTLVTQTFSAEGANWYLGGKILLMDMLYLVHKV